MCVVLFRGASCIGGVGGWNVFLCRGASCIGVGVGRHACVCVCGCAGVHAI